MPVVPVPDALPFLALPGVVLLPLQTYQFVLHEHKHRLGAIPPPRHASPPPCSGRAVDAAFWDQDKFASLFGFVPSLSAPDTPMAEQALHPIGTAGRITRVTRTRRNAGPVTVTVTMEGLCRISIKPLEAKGRRMAQVRALEDRNAALAETSAAAAELRRLVALGLDTSLRAWRAGNLLSSLSIAMLCDVTLASIGLAYEDKLKALDMLDVAERCEFAVELLGRIVKNVPPSMLEQLTDKSDDSVASRRGAKGSDTDSDDELDNAEDPNTLQKLRARLKAAGLSLEAKRVAAAELKKLEQMEASHNTGPEHQKGLLYLDWLASLPWSSSSADAPADLPAVRRQLDEDHHGLDKIKRRIVEFVAVRGLRGRGKGSILCFVGPPGVGKTSLGRSIAQALHRQYDRISLGGIRDEADIRGFNRTYVGSQPGRIMHALRRAGTNNPVIVLDEIDKAVRFATMAGDPSAALLEVLDPAQNHTFHDHFVAVPFDLSQVRCICSLR